MKKRVYTIFLILIVSLLFVSCGSSRASDEGFSQQIWTQEELKELSGKDTFKPRKPQENEFILVVSSDNLISSMEKRELGKNEINEQAASLLNTLTDIEGLKESTKAVQEESTPVDPEEAKLREAAMEAAREKDVDADTIQLKMALNPDNASIKIEYTTEYIDPKPYSAGVGNTVTSVYSNHLILTAYDLVTGEEIASTAFLNSPEETVSVPIGATALYMYSSDFDENEYNRTKLLEFLSEIQANI